MLAFDRPISLENKNSKIRQECHRQKSSALKQEEVSIETEISLKEVDFIKAKENKESSSYVAEF